MKAKINIDGVMAIVPETDIEAYALKMWWDNYCIKDTTKPSILTVSYHVEEDFLSRPEQETT